MLWFLLACSGPEKESAEATYVWKLPEGFPTPVVPADNPMSDEKVELGRYLFYDKRLSGNETQSCGSCHQPQYGFTDGKANAEGSTGQIHRRSSMSVVNVGYFSGLTWASNVVKSLEAQALLPLFGETPVELGMAGLEEELFARLAADAEYPARFSAAFPDEEDPINLGNITKAIAGFQRSLISGGSPYDQLQYGGDPSAMTAEARRGMALFFSEELECFHCHQGFAFTDSVQSESTTFEELLFHNTGLYNLDGAGAYPIADQGLYELTLEPADMGRFRAPTLRNIAKTAPYMHDGSIATLEEVVDHYAAGGRTISDGENAGVGSANPYKSEFVTGFTLTEEQRTDLLAFLNALTDEDFLTSPEVQDPF